MRRGILGTAGHIDHGKTALVRALTGVDTDRLPEEKARGITIDLGFAELEGEGEIRLGVVDVPGHEDLVRTMVAGATGMDVVLLAVAADEGIMPQTAEHLDILRILDVPHMVVALTKADLVDPEWLALVEEDVRGALAGTPYASAPVLATSVRDGRGLQEVRSAILAAAGQARARQDDDLAFLPLDRAFTVPGMGTVVTGTLWSGTVTAGGRARLLPGGREARIRSVQVHGRDTASASAGERTALALSGVDRSEAERGQVLVTDGAWTPGRLLTIQARVLGRASRPLEHGDRVRVLHGTAEVMARCAVLDGSGEVGPGGTGWVQLRLEEPLLARTGDRLVIRSYSPLLTLGGGVVVEPCPPRRRRLEPGQDGHLGGLASADPAPRLDGALALAGWGGVSAAALPQRTGLTPPVVAAALKARPPAGTLVVKGTAFAPGVVSDAATLVLAALDQGHATDSLRPSVPLERLRRALPAWAAPALADGVLDLLARDGRLELAEGGARRPGFNPTPTADQEEACRELRALYAAAELAPPFTAELPDHLRTRPDLPRLLRLLEGEGTLRTVDDGLLVAAAALEAAGRAITATLAGRTGLGPADFRDVVPVSRRHLMPLLAHFDGMGVTVRRGPVRDVPPHG